MFPKLTENFKYHLEFLVFVHKDEVDNLDKFKNHIFNIFEVDTIKPLYESNINYDFIWNMFSFSDTFYHEIFREYRHCDKGTPFNFVPFYYDNPDDWSERLSKQIKLQYEISDLWGKNHQLKEIKDKELEKLKYDNWIINQRDFNQRLFAQNFFHAFAIQYYDFGKIENNDLSFEDYKKSFDPTSGVTSDTDTYLYGWGFLTNYDELMHFKSVRDGENTESLEPYYTSMAFFDILDAIQIQHSTFDKKRVKKSK